MADIRSLASTTRTVLRAALEEAGAPVVQITEEVGWFELDLLFIVQDEVAGCGVFELQGEVGTWI